MKHNKFLYRISYQKRRAMFSFLFVLPWIVGFLLFSLKPLADVFIYSFNKVSFLPDATIKLKFVGFDNYYTILFVHSEFLTCLMDYLYEMLLTLPVVVVFSLLIALMLNGKIKGRGFFRVVYFMPVVLMQGPLMEIVDSLDAMSISGVDTMFVFSFIQNQLPKFIADSLMYVIRNFSTLVWYCGVQILVCLAGLQKMDKNMYEAANIDGASSWQIFWKITLPVSRPFILLSAIYTVVDLSTMDRNSLIQIIFDHMFSEGSGFGYPSAVAVMYFLIMLMIAGIVLLLLGKNERKPVKA